VISEVLITFQASSVLNKYVHFEVNFDKFDIFERKKLNPEAWLILRWNNKFLSWLSPKFHRLQISVVPSLWFSEHLQYFLSLVKH